MIYIGISGSKAEYEKPPKTSYTQNPKKHMKKLSAAYKAATTSTASKHSDVPYKLVKEQYLSCKSNLWN